MSAFIWERTAVRIPGRFEIAWNRLGLALALIFDADERWPWMLHVHFLFLNLFLHFPAPRIAEDPGRYGEWQQFGFSVVGDCVHFMWGYKFKSRDWPWAYKFLSNEVLREDGKFVPCVNDWEREKQPDGRKKQTFSYAYILRGGEVQHRMAEVYVERYTWRRRWLYWTAWRQMSRTSINVSFSDEVGERTGSWKGGTIGCSYEMKPNETPERCLRRMEQERKF